MADTYSKNNNICSREERRGGGKGVEGGEKRRGGEGSGVERWKGRIGEGRRGRELTLFGIVEGGNGERKRKLKYGEVRRGDRE